MSIERMTELTKTINALTDELNKIGRSMPPVTVDEVKRDSVFIAHVREWMREWMKEIDTTVLDRDDRDKWELLNRRFDVREWEGNDGETVYGIFDMHDGVLLDREFDEDADACNVADNLERDWQDGFYGFPFAWNTGWVLESERWTDELGAAGFLVYRYDDDTIIAGIDGGGYAFMDAHFVPFYAALAEQNEWLVETKHGPRRITNKTKEAA